MKTELHFVGGNGKSMCEAIIIEGVKNGREGVAAEKDWLREHMSGWVMVSQALIEEGSKAYDGLTVRSGSGEERVIYFDITNFFGKF
jgi:hypothetical protein